MRKPFEETTIGGVLSAAIDVLLAGLLWCLCSLPVVTIGPASTALYYTTAKSIRHERGRVAATFFKSFRQNLAVSLKAWLLLLLWLLVCAANLFLSGGMENGQNALLRNLSLILMLPAVFLFLWGFPFISRFENTVIGSLKYAFYLSLKYFGTTLLLLVELAAFLLAGWLLPPLIPLLPGICCLVLSYSIEPALKAAASGTEDNNSDRWYNE